MHRPLSTAVDYPGLDPALVPIHEHVAALLPRDLMPQEAAPGPEERAAVAPGSMTLEAITLSMPIELDVLATDGGVSLGSSPPLHFVETSMLPAPHRIRITIVADEELLDEQPQPQPQTQTRHG